jgi:hypothetical protein
MTTSRSSPDKWKFANLLLKLNLGVNENVARPSVLHKLPRTCALRASERSQAV